VQRPPATEPAGTIHWLLQKEEPRRRRLDAQAIVTQAHALVHEGGAPALSMRALAAALGTSPTGLYRHFPSKQWLLVAVVDHVLAEVETSPTDADGVSGRERLERLSASLREVLSAHPHLHEILTSHVAITPSTVRMAEAALGCLRDCGISDAQLVDAYNAWCGYVIGFTAIEAKPPELAPDPQLQQAMRAQIERATAHDFPIVSELVPQFANLAYGLSWLPGRLGEARTSFEWGLKALLDGIECSNTKRRTE
jgi:TetR/AcrR family transcriptional regulator, tetracycline repressor protein